MEIENSLPETALWGYFASILPIVAGSLRFSPIRDTSSSDPPLWVVLWMQGQKPV